MGPSLAIASSSCFKNSFLFEFLMQLTVLVVLHDILSCKPKLCFLLLFDTEFLRVLIHKKNWQKIYQ